MVNALLAGRPWRTQCGLLRRASLALAQHRSFSPLPETTSAEKAIEAAAAQPGQGENQPRHVARWFPGAALRQFGRDLTDQARRGLLDPVIGREAIVQRALQVILRRAKNNPCLIGDAGVGKTAIVEGIAQLMVSPQVPLGLAGKRLIALDVTSLVAGSAYRGEFEGRLRGLLKDVADARGSVILFIDEMHMLMGAGASEGGLDASNILKPALARGGMLQCIGATTVEEWRQHIEPDAAFTRRWQPIMVPEPSPEAAYACLQGLRPRYEAHHSVVITDAALKAAVRCAKRHITDRKLPDSAIDIIDESAARCLLRAAMESSKAAQACEAEAAAAAEQARVQSHAHAFPSTSIPGRGPGTDAAHSGNFDLGNSNASVNSRNNSSTSSSSSSNSSSIHKHGGGSESSVANSEAKRAQLTDWQSWVARHGWRGQTEFERQQLLEWFGATPEHPAPGSDGHRQTVAKRSRVRQAGASGSTTSTTLVEDACPGSGGDAWSNGSSSAKFVPPFLTLNSIPEGVRRLEVAPHAFSRSKACPQCGFLCDVRAAKLSDDGLRLRCPSCTTSFLNIPPEKLLLGTSTFQADPPPFHHNSTPAAAAASAPWPGFTQQQQQQQQQQQVWHTPQQQPDLGFQGAVTQGQGQEHVPATESSMQGHMDQQQQQGQIDVASITPEIQQLQLQRQRQEEKARAFARPFPILGVVDEPDVLDAVTEATGVPVTALDNQSAHQLVALEQTLSKVVLGQDAAVRAVASAVRLWRMGLLQADHRPAASFVFRGPPGVGKSLMCKELAHHVMGDEQALIRLQMSEYTDRASLARLLGAPPGYVGYGKASGTLVDAVRRRPHCVLVLEDVDRAHPEVQEVLLRIVDEGSLSDSQGRRASFESAFVIFTFSQRAKHRAAASRSKPQSHHHNHQQQQQQHEDGPLWQGVPGAHASDLGNSHAQGSAAAAAIQNMQDEAAPAERSQAGALASAQEASRESSSGSSAGHPPASSQLSPAVLQLLSLVDATIDFGPLERQHLARIVEAQLADSAAQVATVAGVADGPAGVALEVDEAARQFLVDMVEGGRAGGPGAQHVQSLIRTHVMGPLAEQLLLLQAQQVQSSSSIGKPRTREVGVHPTVGRKLLVRVSFEGSSSRGDESSGVEGGTGSKLQVGVSGESRRGRLVFQFSEADDA